MKPIEITVVCSICGSDGILKGNHGRLHPWDERNNYYHTDPRVCKSNLKQRQISLKTIEI